MNSYPAELIQHHYACMLVSGLLPSQAQIASPESNKAALPQVDGKEHLPEAVSPPTAAASTSGTSTGSPKSSRGTASKAPTPAQAFPQVTKDLCDIFGSRGRSSAWDPSKLQSAVFHTVLVDNVSSRGEETVRGQTTRLMLFFDSCRTYDCRQRRRGPPRGL